MNWCKPHWDQLRKAIDDKGLTPLVAKDGVECTTRMQKGEFEPLMYSLFSVANQMKQNPRCTTEDLLACPCCVLVRDEQPHLVENWIDGVTTDALNAAIHLQLITFN